MSGGPTSRDYQRCAHCHLFVERNPFRGDSPGLAEWVHLTRGDAADDEVESSHEAAPSGEVHDLDWWREHGPAMVRLRFVYGEHWLTVTPVDPGLFGTPAPGEPDLEPVEG